MISRKKGILVALAFIFVGFIFYVGSGKGVLVSWAPFHTNFTELYEDSDIIIRGARALGGSLPFALIKALGMGTDGFHFMKGYFSRKDVEKHEDVAKFVKKQQYERGLAIC